MKDNATSGIVDVVHMMNEFEQLSRHPGNVASFDYESDFTIHLHSGADHNWPQKGLLWVMREAIHCKCDITNVLACMAGGQSALTGCKSSTQQVDMKMNTMPETINANKMPRPLFVGSVW